MFVLRAADGDVGCLHLGVLKLGLGLGDVGLYGDAAGIAVLGDAYGFGVLCDGIVEELLLSVGSAELEVVHRDFSLEREQGALAVGGGGLRLFARRGDAAMDSSPEVDLVV